MTNALAALFLLLTWLAWAVLPLSWAWSRPSLLAWTLALGWAIGLVGVLAVAILRPHRFH